jgi:uncharacterized surface protein with fasciclin (FAS1) repeats
MIPKVLILISTLVLVCQAQQAGNLNKNILSFLKSNKMGSTFVQLLERVAQQAQDQTVIQALGGTGNRVLPTDNSGQSGGYTVFVPVNSALTGIQINDQTIYDIRNDMYNLIMKRRISMEMMKQQKNGMNVTEALTFGFQPRLQLRMVSNFYNRQLDETVSMNTNVRRKRQYTSQNNSNGQNNNQNNQNNQNGQNNKNQNNQFPNNNAQNKQFPNNNMNMNNNMNTNNNFNTVNGNRNPSNSESNLYEQYEEIYGKQQAYQGPPISPKLPQDELYLLNNGIILDKFECTNGIVYFIDAYPQYYDHSLYMLAKKNQINGFGQNINVWINKADQSWNQGNENLKNALNAYGPNTFFLPTDQSFNKFTDRQLLNNDSFLVDTLLKAHRISGQVLYDYYLDDPKMTYMTDAKLPVSTRHRYVNNKIEIEVSIGHVKGKILPEFRNIYCASGVIHLVDTILGVPTESAYKRIAANPQLSTFRSLIDASSYRQTLDRSPMNTNWNINNINNNNNINNQNNNNFKQMTILAPNEFALLAIKDELLKNTTALEEFLGTHIITDTSNKVFFTDHDQSVFTNGRTYQTMNPQQSLMANVQLDPDGVNNNVVLSLQSNPSIRATIVNGNDLVSNGVIHIVDKPLTLFTTRDITGLLEKYSNMNGPGQPAFSQFVDALRSTGIFNDLKQPSKMYTLFIPTNEALSRYQDIMKGNDQEKKKQLIWRHICIDQNLQSKNLASNNSQSNIPSQPQEGQLICRNALGQDLTLTKDSYGLISKWQGMASSKIINDFPGVYSSAYLLDTPLLNHNMPNLGLHKFSSAIGLKSSMLVMFISFMLAYLF